MAESQVRNSNFLLNVGLNTKGKIVDSSIKPMKENENWKSAQRPNQLESFT